MGTPATPGEIREYLGENVTPRSLHVALSRDPRLVKAGPKLWGLGSWNLPRYEGMAREMRKILEERGEMPVRELTRIMTQRFGAGEASFRSAANGREFATTGGTIRLRDSSKPAPGKERCPI